MAITPDQFREWLRSRRESGETLAAIGADLGTGRQAVVHWLAGVKPNGPTLRLAELLMQQTA